MFDLTLVYCSLQGNRTNKEEPITQVPSKQPPKIIETVELKVIPDEEALCYLIFNNLRGQLSPRKLDPHLTVRFKLIMEFQVCLIG